MPTDKKFGYSFALIFLVISIYFYFKNIIFTSIIFLILFLIFTFVSFLFPKILNPINKFWFFLGLILNKIFSPIIIGFIYFLIFTPISIISKIFGRDELRIYTKEDSSYIVYSNSKQIKETIKNLKNQF
tara:strand:- start:36 stop:422 length:387 start_codon:yes stop_codon:yes gene_type:complete